MMLKNLLASLVIAGTFTLFVGCESKDSTKPAAGGTTGGAAATTGGDSKPAGTTGGAASSASMSADDKHKLYQAAATTGDQARIMEMYKKLGFMKSDGMSMDQEAMQKFTTEHGTWAQKNVDFITKELSSPDKAKAYYDAHK